MLTTLSITQFDIRDGRRGCASGCPVSIAGTRLLKPDLVFVVYGPTAAIRHRDAPQGSGFVVDLPDAAFDWIRAFEESKKVEPFEFQAPIPAKFLRAA